MRMVATPVTSGPMNATSARRRWPKVKLTAAVAELTTSPIEGLASLRRSWSSPRKGAQRVPNVSVDDEVHAVWTSGGCSCRDWLGHGYAKRARWLAAVNPAGEAWKASQRVKNRDIYSLLRMPPRGVIEHPRSHDAAGRL